nr:SGNH/GDSL hydrolase family protein [Oscillatoria sp. FACHB-1406]
MKIIWGFGNPPLYIADEKIGYLLAPNQRLRRMGNRIEINEYSMRSPSVARERPEGTLRVLLLGDSVANGGWWTDRAQTISYLMQEQLQQGGQTVEVLNASANSWSPRNELAYVRRFGLFGAQVVVLLINTDDLFGTKPSSLQVGRDRNYPDRKPPLALVEAYTKYFVKQKPIPGLAEIHKEEGDRVGINLEAIGNLNEIARANNSQLILAMTPLLREIGKPGPRDYELTARERVKQFVNKRDIFYLDFLVDFNAHSDPKTLYRDHIHLSPLGNEKVRDRVVGAISKQIAKL